MASLSCYREGLLDMNSLSFSASATISSVVGMCSDVLAFACKISLASCRSSSLISYGVLLDNLVSFLKLSLHVFIVYINIR